MPSATSSKSSSILRFFVTFLVVYLVVTTTMRLLFPAQFGSKEPANNLPPLTLIPQSDKIPLGRNFTLTVRNLSSTGIVLSDHCPKSPIIIERQSSNGFDPIEAISPSPPCTPLTTIPAESSVTIDMSPWKYDAFSVAGIYRLSLPSEALEQLHIESQNEHTMTNIEIRSPNVFVASFRAFISKPLFNGLLFIASVLPNHSLGWSIIILTIIVKLVLLIPSQHALQSQQKLQLLQPKLDAIKKKHAGNQQRITEETMKLWKEEKINPLQSCLPTLLQIPILLGLFFIIRDSGSLELARHLLYPPFQEIDWTFMTRFMGFLDLTHIPYDGMEWIPNAKNVSLLVRNMWVPLSVATLQFAQMKMAFAKKQPSGQKEKKPLAERLDTQTMMIYMLPIMIFFIAGGMPNAVSLYWGASTVFSIGQQVVVNRKGKMR